MNNDEFTIWTDYHCGAFPPLIEWLSKTPGTLGHWERALSDVTLESAKLATDAMLSGKLDGPRGYGDHPRTIRQWCRTALGSFIDQPRYVDGDQTYHCPDCRDEGTRLVVHPETQRAVRVGGGEHHWMTCAVACQCSAGDRWRDGVQCSPGKQDRRIPVFDGSKMFPIATQLPTVAEREDYRSWLSDGERRAESLPNYETF